MATVAQLQAVTSNGFYVHTLTVTVIGQDVVANTTRLAYRYDVHSNRSFQWGAWTQLGNVSFSVNIGGVPRSQVTNFDFRVRKDITMMSGEVTVPNNPNGSLNVPLALSTSGLVATQFLPLSASGVTLPAPVIPRASTFTASPNPVIEGGTVDIAITRASTSFTHDITWVSGSNSGTIGLGIPTSATFTPDPALLNGGTKAPITITVVTKSGATVIGSASTDIILRAVPVYPEIGVGTPYDLRFRRTAMEGTNWVVKENIPFIEATVTDTMSASGSCNLTISKLVYPTNLDNAVVVADVYDGANWLDTGMVFVLTRSEGDRTDMEETVRYSGMSYVDFILSKGTVAADLDWPVTTPGDIISQYMAIAQARGWGPKLTKTFTAGVTTLGTPWQNTTDISTTKDTPISQLLQGFVSDVLVEYRSYFDEAQGKAVLELFNPGYGSDWSVNGADPIVNMSTAGLFKVADAAPVRKDFADKLTRVSVQGDETSMTREAASAVDPMFGHLEGSVAASGVADAGRLAQLGDALLAVNGTATVERTFSYDLSSTQTPHSLYPYRTFRPGDWILAPGENGPERSRVSQVAITRNVDGTVATITVGDLIPSGVVATARKLAQAGGNAIPGGTLASPLPLSAAIPAAPVNLVATVDGYWDETGAPKSGLYVTWNPVTTSLNGTSMIVDVYEVWTRAEAGSPWTLAALSDTNSATVTGLNINTALDVQVRGRSQNGVYGSYSDFESVVTPEPDETLESPSAPLLEADALGSVAVTWNGLIGGAVPPIWFSFVQAEISDAETGAYTVAGQQLQGAGTISVPNIGAGTWWFRLVGYDTLNHRGATSTPVSIVVTPVIADNRVPKAPENLVLSSEGYWDGSSPESTVTASWDAVTEDVDGAPIDVALYEVWGRIDGTAVSHVIGTTDGTSIDIAPIGPVGATWHIKVRAMGTNNVLSAFSSEETVVIDAPDLALDPPTAPSLDSQRGLLLVSWDGNLLGLDEEGEEFAYPAPAYLTHVDIWVSTDAGDTYTRRGFMMAGDRTQSVSGLSVGDTAQVILVGVDRVGNQTAGSVASSIVIVGIDGADILAGTVRANTIEAGAINVNHLAPGVGNSIDISGNVTITATQEAITGVQDGVDQNSDNLAEMRTRYDFTPTEALISQPGSAFQVAISNTQLEFREAGVARAYLNAGVFNAPRLATNQLVLRYHVIEDDAGGAGTVMRRL